MRAKVDKLLEQYDSYVITNFQSYGQVYINIELISNKWYRFNKNFTFPAEQDSGNWWAGSNAKIMIQRCENHFGY